MADFTMPSLGADMDSGKITQWLVEPGDVVHKGDIIAVIDTAKAAIEVEVFTDGTVAELLVEPGVEVPVGTSLARIDEAGEPAEPADVADQPTGSGGTTRAPGSESASDSHPDDSGSDPVSQSAGSGPAGAGRSDQGDVDTSAVSEITSAGRAQPDRDTDERMSAEEPAAHDIPAEATEPEEGGPHGPAPIDGTEVPVDRVERGPTPMPHPPLRHLAHQLGVDLDTLTGTGPNGKITRADVVSAGQRLVGDAGGAAEAQRTPDTRAQATPLARRLAGEHGIDLAGLTGSGASGRILAADVRDAAASRAVSGAAEQADSADTEAGGTAGGTTAGADAPATPGARRSRASATAGTTGAGDRPGTPDRRPAMRAAIASLMSRSAAEIPHYYVSTTIDMAGPLEWLAEHNRERPPGERVLPVALFLHAVVTAAQRVPDLSGHWVDGAFAPADGVSPSVAIATREGGLVTPRIVGADQLSVDELMAALADLVRRARRGNLRADELQPGSITLSSLSDGGPDALLGVIYPPQVALVGIGAVAERPWAIDGMLTVRPTVTISLAADHRASDGRTGAAFLAALTGALEPPEEP